MPPTYTGASLSTQNKLLLMYNDHPYYYHEDDDNEKNNNGIKKGWNRMFHHLKVFKQKYGHCNVPYNYKTTDVMYLGPWVSQQRISYHSSNCDLSENQINELKSIQFNFELTDGSKIHSSFDRGTSSTNSSDSESHTREQRQEQNFTYGCYPNTKTSATTEGYSATWDHMFNCLLQYKYVHGDCLVPIAYVAQDGTRLGEWVKLQRIFYKNRQMSMECFNKLNSIGFVFILKEHEQRHCMVNQQHIPLQNQEYQRRYQNQHNQTKTMMATNKRHYSNNHILNEKQRQHIYYDHHGLHQQHPQQINYQQSRQHVQTTQPAAPTTVNWGNHPPTKKITPPQWECMYNILLQFKQNFGHCLVPTTYRWGSLELGSWLLEQQSLYDSNKLNIFHYKKLKCIGVRFKLKGNKRLQRQLQAIQQTAAAATAAAPPTPPAAAAATTKTTAASAISKKAIEDVAIGTNNKEKTITASVVKDMTNAVAKTKRLSTACNADSRSRSSKNEELCSKNIEESTVKSYTIAVTTTTKQQQNKQESSVVKSLSKATVKTTTGCNKENGATCCITNTNSDTSSRGDEELSMKSIKQQQNGEQRYSEYDILLGELDCDDPYKIFVHMGNVEFQQLIYKNIELYQSKIPTRMMVGGTKQGQYILTEPANHLLKIIRLKQMKFILKKKKADGSYFYENIIDDDKKALKVINQVLKDYPRHEWGPMKMTTSINDHEHDSQQKQDTTTKVAASKAITEEASPATKINSTKKRPVHVLMNNSKTDCLAQTDTVSSGNGVIVSNTATIKVENVQTSTTFPTTTAAATTTTTATSKVAHAAAKTTKNQLSDIDIFVGCERTKLSQTTQEKLSLDTSLERIDLRIFTHKGNIAFQEIMYDNLELYAQLGATKGMKICQLILQILKKKGALFVIQKYAKNNDNRYYYESIDDDEALLKLINSIFYNLLHLIDPGSWLKQNDTIGTTTNAAAPPAIGRPKPSSASATTSTSRKKRSGSNGITHSYGNSNEDQLWSASPLLKKRARTTASEPLAVAPTTISSNNIPPPRWDDNKNILYKIKHGHRSGFNNNGCVI